MNGSYLAKEKILKKIRHALTHPTPVPLTQTDGTSNVFARGHSAIERDVAGKCNS